MVSWLRWLGLGEPCHRCGAAVTHRPDLFRIDDRQCCPECHAVLFEIAERRRQEEVALGRVVYGGRVTAEHRRRAGIHQAETPVIEDRRSRR